MSCLKLYKFYKNMLEGLQQIISDRPIQPTSNDGLPQQTPIASSAKKERAKSIFMDIRINADDQSSCKLAAYWIIIIAIIVIVSLLSGLARRNVINLVPTSVLEKNQIEALSDTNLKDCNHNLVLTNSEIACGPETNSMTSGQLVTNLQSLNQFLAFYLNLTLDLTSIQFNENIYFRLYKSQRHTSENGTIFLKASKILSQNEVSITSDYFRQRYFYINYVNDIEAGDQYYWQIQFKINSKIHNYPYSLQSFVINPKFSLFCIILRLTFMLLSILFLAVTGLKFFKMDPKGVTPEQKVVLFLSAVTVTFNDPFYIGTILAPSSFTYSIITCRSFLSTFFTWNFLTTLFVIWVFFLQRIKDEEGEIQTQLKTCPNIASIVIFYIINMVFRVGLALQQTNNHPFTDPNSKDSELVSTMFIISTLVFLVVLFYIFYLYCELWSRPQLMWRNSLFIYISFFFFLVIFYLFMVGSYNVFEYSARKVIFAFTFTNIYSFYLQYMYMPSYTSAKQMKPQKDVEHDLGQLDSVDISIDLENEGYDVFMEYGTSKLSDEEENIGKSYLGEHTKAQGSKILHLKAPQEQAIKQVEEKSIPQQKEREQQGVEEGEEPKAEEESEMEPRREGESYCEENDG